MTALTGVQVLELVEPRGEHCGRLLAGFGADVFKLEPVTGAPSRHLGPFVGAEHDPERSLRFWHDNVGKGSVVVGGDVDVHLRARAADVLVHTIGAAEARERGLTYDALAADNPGLVVCAITPFGHTGPWADWRGDDLVLMATGGLLATSRAEPGDRPVAPYGDHAWRTACTYAALAVVAALAWRLEHEEGQFVDVSVHEAVAALVDDDRRAHRRTGTVPPPRGRPRDEPVRHPEDVLEDESLRARGHFVEVDDVVHAGAPFHASASPFRFERPPPRLGEDGP